MASIAAPVRHSRTWTRLYFPVIFLVLAALSLVAFWDNLVSDITQPSNSQPRMIVHGLFAFGWMVLLFVQAMLVRGRNIALHRKVGLAAFLVAIGVTLSTIYLFVVIWKGWAAMDPQIKANRILLPSFSLAILAAYFNRRRAIVHKRLVLAGTLFLMEPILARTFDPLIGPMLPPMAPGEDMPIFYAYMVLAWSALFASLLAYDRATLGRFHPISTGAFGWTALVCLLTFTVL